MAAQPHLAVSRFRRLIHSVASGYVALAATALYALASFPLALHYLPKERLALWTLMSTVGGWLSQIDLGMSSSLARLLIDHKDDRDGGAYGSLIRTGWLVLIVQGTIILLSGFALAPVVASLLAIQSDLRPEFVALVRWQAVILAFGFGVKIFAQLLSAHQRMDVINYTQVGGSILAFGLLWIFFHRGQGVYSLVWANLLGTIITSLFLVWTCWRLLLLPSAGSWGTASWSRFKEIFDYGKDLFLVALGSQIVMTSQPFIITRALGLVPANDWGWGTKLFTLISLVIWRISDMACLAFSEMIVRGEKERLRERYKAVFILTMSLSGFAAVGYALCNSFFVRLWSHGAVVWPPMNDVLLGVWLIILSIVHVHNGFMVITKKIGFMRYIYFTEGLAFVLLAALMAGRFGMPAVILCSIFCSCAFTGAYGIWRVSRYFEQPIAEAAFRWLAPMVRVLLVFVPVAAALWWASASISGPLLRLIFHFLIAGSIGLPLFLRYGLPRPVQIELLERAPKPMNPVLRRVFVGL